MPSLRALAGCAVLGTLVSGCRNVTSPRSDQGLATIAVAGSVPTIEGPSVTLRIANAGQDTVLVEACGSGPRLLLERFTGGQWTNYGPATICAISVPPGPIGLAPGASMQTHWIFSESGRYRAQVRVAAKRNPTAYALVSSAAFDIP